MEFFFFGDFIGSLVDLLVVFENFELDVEELIDIEELE